MVWYGRCSCKGHLGGRSSAANVGGEALNHIALAEDVYKKGNNPDFSTVGHSMGVRKDDAVRFVLSKLGGYVAKEGKRARQPSIPYTVSTCLSLTRSSWGWILDRTRHSSVQ